MMPSEAGDHAWCNSIQHQNTFAHGPIQSYKIFPSIETCVGLLPVRHSL
jgi:hypothetical protein